MNIVIFFSSVFYSWPLKLVEQMQLEQPNLKIIALTNDNKVYKKLTALPDGAIKEVHNFNELEQQWMERPLDSSRLSALENELGSDLLLKTLIADKSLGKGWIGSAVLYDTPLSAMLKDHHKQRQYMTGLFDFLTSLYKEQRPDLSLVYAVAGGLSYGVAATSRHYGVPCVQFQGGRIDNYRILDTSVEGLLEPVQDMLLQAQKNPSLLEPYQQEAKDKLAELRASKAKPSILGYVEQNRRQATKPIPLIRAGLGCLVRAAKKAINPGAVDLREKSEKQKFFYSVTCKVLRNSKRIHRHFRDFEPFKEQEYVYFPLHLDPEASTLVYSPYHTNQLGVIEALSKQIPLSSHLLVKEHPVMLGQRPLDFYRKIEAMPNVTMIKPEVPSDLLIKHASIVATITGTAGWEAILLGKPAIIIGQVPYTAIGEGFIQCPDLTQLHEAIRKARSLKPASDDAIVRFIASIMKVGIRIPDALIWNYSENTYEGSLPVSQQVAKTLLSISTKSLTASSSVQIANKA